MNISQNIRKIRELRNLTQEFLADEMKVSQSTYCRIEHGSVKVDFNRICQIAEVLHVNYRLLIDFDERVILNSFSLPATPNIVKTNHPNCEGNSRTDHSICEELIKCIKEIQMLRAIIDKYQSSSQTNPTSF
ncbi:MAG: XRE family transcriptional regulator [Clostridia bacterium]|nr:XRE family transcriptional regulator [Clostridia bacterium]